MKTLQQYLIKKDPNKSLIDDCVANDLAIIAVIPCYNEPDIIKTLMSIEKCTYPKKNVEIIIVINSSELTDNKIININRKTKSDIIEWQKKTCKFSYNIIHIENIPKKYAGVGYARKTGMDEAIRRFVKSGTNNGIICSLDADTLIKSNYFVEIEKLFSTKKCNACSIYFEHDIEGTDFQTEVYKRITEYELHLRYYSNSLIYSGFPYYHYTVGSAFAIAARSYCMQGGMNTKQAGEDFYFLQKIMQTGNFYHLKSTAVYPSPRPSDRVIFGTGPTIKAHIQNPDKQFVTYNFDAFIALKALFDDRILFFKINDDDFNRLVLKYHISIRDFLNLSKFKSAIDTINNNIADVKNFNRKFYHWFNGFRVVKYLNFAHEKYFNKIPIENAVTTLLSNLNKTIDYKDKKDLLRKIRKICN